MVNYFQSSIILNTDLINVHCGIFYSDDHAHTHQEVSKFHGFNDSKSGKNAS